MSYGSDFDVILLCLISQFPCLDHVSKVAELCPRIVLLLGDVRVCSTYHREREKKIVTRITNIQWQ